MNRYITFAKYPVTNLEYREFLKSTGAIDNIYEKIMDRINNRCCKTAKQLPNFVAVDFYEVPLETEDKAHKVIAELNRRWQNSEGCSP